MVKGHASDALGSKLKPGLGTFFFLFQLAIIELLLLKYGWSLGVAKITT